METTAETGRYKILCFHILIAAKEAFSPAINKKLHTILIKICFSENIPIFLTTGTTQL